MEIAVRHETREECDICGEERTDIELHVSRYVYPSRALACTNCRQDRVQQAEERAEERAVRRSQERGEPYPTPPTWPPPEHSDYWG